jgi:prepilin-type N-terminal cleavage/methylation domain-containing protein
MQLNTPAGKAGRRFRAESGLTLVELLVVIAILGIIALPLGNAMIAFFQHENDTNQRLAVSHDVQIASAYFSQDVASIGVHNWGADGFPPLPSVEVDVGPQAGLSWCGPAGTPVEKVRMAWDDPTSPTANPQVRRVAYVVETVGGERQLHRLECNGPAQSPTLLSDIVLAHNLDPSFAPTVTCTPNPSCTPPGTPQTVTLQFKLHATNSSEPAVTVTLTGTRRQS